MYVCMYVCMHMCFYAMYAYGYARALVHMSSAPSQVGYAAIWLRFGSDLIAILMLVCFGTLSQRSWVTQMSPR